MADVWPIPPWPPDLTLEQQAALIAQAGALAGAVYPPNTPQPPAPAPGQPDWWSKFWDWLKLVFSVNAPVLPTAPVDPAP